jgi:hypothetical protein
MSADSLATRLGWILLAMVAVWFVLLRRLLIRLEHDHPDTYTALGRPTLLPTGGLASTLAVLATLRFLFAREHRALRDPALSRLSDGMLAFLIAYLLLFGWVCVLAS